MWPNGHTVAAVSSNAQSEIRPTPPNLVFQHLTSMSPHPPPSIEQPTSTSIAERDALFITPGQKKPITPQRDNDRLKVYAVRPRSLWERGRSLVAVSLSCVPWLFCPVAYGQAETAFGRSTPRPRQVSAFPSSLRSDCGHPALCFPPPSLTADGTPQGGMGILLVRFEPQRQQNQSRDIVSLEKL